MHSDSPAARTAARLGATVRHRRRKLGLDQDSVALVSGVSRRTVHAIENGKATAQLSAIVAVLNALGLDLAALPKSEVSAAEDRHK